MLPTYPDGMRPLAHGGDGRTRQCGRGGHRAGPRRCGAGLGPCDGAPGGRCGHTPTARCVGRRGMARRAGWAPPGIDAGTHTLRGNEIGATGAVVSRFEAHSAARPPRGCRRWHPRWHPALASGNGPRAGAIPVPPGHALRVTSRKASGPGTPLPQLDRANRAPIRDPDPIFAAQVVALPETDPANARPAPPSAGDWSLPRPRHRVRRASPRGHRPTEERQP